MVMTLENMNGEEYRQIYLHIYLNFLHHTPKMYFVNICKFDTYVNNKSKLLS